MEHVRVVLWELAKLVQLGRVELDLHDREIARTLDGIHLWPTDFTIARMSTPWTSGATRQTSSSPPRASSTTCRC